MKALVVYGSRADRNGLEVVHEALLKAGHESSFVSYPSQELARAHEPDVIVVGGDRYEMLQFVGSVYETWPGVPIAHIAGGDVTEGSADDRYRDAITALSCIHFATNEDAHLRLVQHLARHTGDNVYLTGSPAIDRIKQTSLLTKEQTLCTVLPQAEIWRKTALVCVHPNTAGPNAMVEADAVYQAMMQLKDMAFICIGANADAGGEQIDVRWRSMSRDYPFISFSGNVSPQVYYSLMAHCDVMIGNSSAMLYEAPCFGLPCVLVGDRQNGRLIPSNVISQAKTSDGVMQGIASALALGRLQTKNPYGDGNSAPRIVKALEENSWRWTSQA